MYATSIFRALVATMVVLGTTVVNAQPSYPSKPVRVVIGFPPGQASEMSARMILQQVSKTLGQPFYIDNRAGASGTIAAGIVASAPPDGYTLLWGSIGPIGIAPSLYKSLPYNTSSDLVPVAQSNTGSQYLAVNASTGVKDVAGLISYVNAHKGEVNYGSAGSGSIQHLLMEMFKHEAHVDLTHVPYKGSSAAMQDLAAGRVQAGFETASVALALSKGGMIRLIGISSKTRSPMSPDVPTIAEQGLPNFEVVSWSGMFAPKGTPPEVVLRLNKAMNEALADPEIIRYLQTTGSQPAGGTPDEFKALVDRELARWAEVVRYSGAALD